MKKINEKATSYIIRGLIALGIGIAGLIYISKMPSPQPKYNPIEVKTGKYNLVDVNNDKKVDVIKIDGIVKYINKPKEINKILGDIPDYRFLGFGKYRSITPEIQEKADLVFNKNLEKVLVEGK